MVLTKEEFLTKIKERIGENPTDEDISFVEDMTDTIDSLTQGDDWQKKKYEENDAMWRKKYTERFFTPDKESEKESEKEPEETKDSEEITIDDLFESEEK